MKQGRNMESLVREVVRQNQVKRDFIAPTPGIKMFADGLATGLELNEEDFGIGDIAHEHIAGFTKIRKDYYDRMRQEAPELLAINVNHWLNANPDNRMVRTLDGNARAMLSPRYRILDNAPLTEVVFEEWQKYGGELILESAEITERRMYMKFVFPSISAEIKPGDVVQAGVTVGNSEIRYGKIYVKRFMKRLICLNGMTMEDGSFKRAHVGRAMDDLEEAYEIFADETKKLDDRAFFSKVRDVFRAALLEENFMRDVETLRESTTRKIEGSVLGAVQILSTEFQFNEGEKNSVLNWLIREGDLTQYGLAQAVTRTAEDVESYDRASDLEKIGGQLIVMPENQWKRLAHASDTDGAPKKRGRKPKNAVIDVQAH